MPGCSRWSRCFPPGCPWICGRHWKEVPRSTRALLRSMWRRMREIWPTDTAWDDLPGRKQTVFKRIDRIERKVWARAIERTMRRMAGI